VDPAVLVEVINTAQAAAQSAPAAAGSAPVLDRAEVYVMIDSLGDVGATLKDATSAGLTRL